MDCTADTIIKSTYNSARESIEGFYFYDSEKSGWYKIIKASFIFVSFEYAFGARWGKKHHKIIDVKRCSKKQSEHLNTCHQSDFRKLRA